MPICNARIGLAGAEVVLPQRGYQMRVAIRSLMK